MFCVIVGTFCVLLICAVESKKIDGPNIYLLGAQNSATSSLYELLVRHPQLCSPPTKEIHYFDKKENFAKGPEYYQTFFNSGCTKGSYIDATPTYLATANFPSLMASTLNPDAIKKKKLIIILRDPIRREFSQYEHTFRTCMLDIKENIRARRKTSSTSNNSVKPMWKASELCGSSLACGQLDCGTQVQQQTLSATAKNKLAVKANVPGNGKVGPQRILGNVDSNNNNNNKVSKVNTAINGNSNRKKESIMIRLANFSTYIQHSAKLEQSMYYNQILSLLKVFKRNQLFIVNFERLTTETTLVMSSLETFLGLKPYFGNVNLPYENAAKVNAVYDCDSRNKLSQYYAKANGQLYDLLIGKNTSVVGRGGGVRAAADAEGSKPPPSQPPFLPFPPKDTYACDVKQMRRHRMTQAIQEPLKEEV